MKISVLCQHLVSYLHKLLPEIYSPEKLKGLKLTRLRYIQNLFACFRLFDAIVALMAKSVWQGWRSDRSQTLHFSCLFDSVGFADCFAYCKIAIHRPFLSSLFYVRAIGIRICKNCPTFLCLASELFGV